MSTKLVSQWKLPQDLAKKLGYLSDITDATRYYIDYIFERFKSKQGVIDDPVGKLLVSCFAEFNFQLKENRWVPCLNNIHFDKQVRGFWNISHDTGRFGKYLSATDLTIVEVDICAKIADPLDNAWSMPSRVELAALTNLNPHLAEFPIFQGRPKGTPSALYKDRDCVRAVNLEGTYSNHNTGFAHPFLPANGKSEENESLFIDFLKKGFTPKLFETSTEYGLLLALMHSDKPHLFQLSRPNAEEILQQGLVYQFVEQFLAEDYHRADIAPYHRKVLEDTALGHWSLWQDEIDSSDFVPVEFASPLVARDPKSSLNDGVVAIDFGTKSTVVVYQKDSVNIHPMRIGTGDLAKEIKPYHYENPTILEFKNLDAFMSAYRAKAHKPHTRWADLTISHTAQNSLQGSEARQFNTFLEEIKQWAGDKNRKLKIVCQQGSVIDLPPFLELQEDDINPIEIYAFYLGLYINNLNNGIYLDYILSFPVTYELPVRDKIIESFKRGLTKSLPEELGPETIGRLTVTKGASEPAAYALTALQSYGFEPEDDERIFYGVFDFGGGTTDFDFGIFREANGKKERRFDYVIEHFGAGGDKFLGGENLLELLAFEVFKKNQTKLLASRIQFELHPEKEPFAGSEPLLSHSQEARNNTKQLCLALRPFWEAHDDFAFDSTGELKLTLTDQHGVQHSGFALDIDEDELNNVLTDRIERGVENFFDALRLAFSQSQKNLSDIDCVQIFLAGNSSRSAIVKQLFDKHIAQHEAEMQLPEGKHRFILFEPLGTESHDVEKPTGKTGVAFGLIASREGGAIKVIDHDVSNDDIRFKFYLGESRKSKFKPIIDRDTPFNQWIEFIDAGYQKFELFYTEQPRASTGQVAIADPSIRKKIVRLDIIDEDAMVYLRVVDPSKIEYVVANEEAVHHNNYLNTIQVIEL